MADIDGLEILARAKRLLPDAEVIVVTGYGTIPSAVAAMQQGAFNYLKNRSIWGICGSSRKRRPRPSA